MGKTGPVLSGCGGNPAILRSRPLQWDLHSLRARPRLAEFPLTTPSAPVVLTDPLLPAKVIVAVKVPVEIAVAEDRSAIPAKTAAQYGPGAGADEVPVARHPITIGPIGGCPDISWSGARRNVGRRCANVDSDASCLGGRCAQSQSSGCQSCPNIHCFVLPIIPPIQAERFARPLRLATTLGLASCRPRASTPRTPALRATRSSTPRSKDRFLGAPGW